MVVVAVAMIGSLTFLPALLSWLGHRVEKGRIPLLGRSRRPVGEGRVWSKVLTPVLKHPVVSVIAAGALLLAIAIPTLSLHTAQDGPKAFPAGAPTIQTLDASRPHSTARQARRSSRPGPTPLHLRSGPR